MKSLYLFTESVPIEIQIDKERGYAILKRESRPFAWITLESLGKQFIEYGRLINEIGSSNNAIPRV